MHSEMLEEGSDLHTDQLRRLNEASQHKRVDILSKFFIFFVHNKDARQHAANIVKDENLSRKLFWVDFTPQASGLCTATFSRHWRMELVS